MNYNISMIGNDKVCMFTFENIKMNTWHKNDIIESSNLEFRDEFCHEVGFTNLSSH